MRRIDETSSEKRPSLGALIEAFAIIPLLLLMPGSPSPAKPEATTPRPAAPAIRLVAEPAPPKAAPASKPAPTIQKKADEAPATPQAHRRVVVSVPDRKLAVLEQDGRVVKVYRVAVGADASPSPIGEYTIVNRVVDPTYYHEGQVVPPGDDNPVGPRWIGLSRAHYAIHGTNAPRSIGKAASHGCIRMRNADVTEFFALVQVGDAVEIHAERDETVAQVFGGTSNNDTTVARSADTVAPAGSL